LEKGQKPTFHHRTYTYLTGVKMASTLQELRKAAGFKNARDFAEELEISGPTYARYESNPEKIPLKAAWSIADRLNVSIDTIVGRKKAKAKKPYSGATNHYDKLSDASRRSADEFIDFLYQKDLERARRKRLEEICRLEMIARHYECLFLDELSKKGDLEDMEAFGSSAEMRDAFKDFLERYAAKRRASGSGEATDERQDEESITKIMGAYDQAHSGFHFGDTDVLWSSVDMRKLTDDSSQSAEDDQEGR
jgi:transcriptional regulator with XRE-family HTH domain